MMPSSLSNGGPDFAKQRYSLLASAVGGRTIPIHWHHNPSLKTYTDLRNIYIAAGEGKTDHVLDVISQALLMRGGSLEPHLIQRLLGRRRAVERYLFAEVARTAKCFQHILPRLYCEQAALAAIGTPSHNAAESLELALGHQALPPIPNFLGTLRITLLLKQALFRSAFTGLTKKQQAGQFDYKSVPRLAEGEEDHAEESKLLKLLQNPLFSGGAVSDLLSKLLGAGTSGQPDKNPQSSGGAEMKSSGVTRADRQGMFAMLTDFALEAIKPREASEPDSRTYHEWDYTTGRYKENWVLADELEPWCEEPMSADQLRALLPPPPALIKRQLSGIGMNFQRHDNLADGDEYSLDRLVDYMVDRSSGVTPNELLYQSRLKTRRDLAVMVLLDVSGSTAEREAGQASVHERQLQLAFQLTSALHELGDQVALYGFHSWGRKLVRLLRLKAFKDQRLDSRFRRRLRQLEPVGYTRTGAALRHGAELLKTETRMPYRVLIVITDGYSYDQEYEGRYAEEDTRKALQEIRADGTGCLCLSIGTDQDVEKLRHMFGPASTLSVQRYEDFSTNIRQTLLGAVAQVLRVA